MTPQHVVSTARTPETSPLMLSDHLITLAEEADRAGYTHTARRLINLACTVFDERPSLPHLGWHAETATGRTSAYPASTYRPEPIAPRPIGPQPV